MTRIILTFLLSCSLLLPITSFANPFLAEAAEGSAETENAASEAEPSKPVEVDIVEALGLDEVSNEVSDTLNQVFADYGINTSLAGQIISTLAVLIVAYLLYQLVRRLIMKGFIALDEKSDRIYLDRGRLRLYQKIVALFVALVMAALASIALTAIWSSDAESVLLNDSLATIFTKLFNLSVVVILSIIAFELISSLVEDYIRKISRNGSPRVNTLLPIVRNVVYGALMIMLGLMVLSQLGIDIVPLLAGAGVIGFAVGFGAQTLIKDLITGFIIIVEDLIQVGDIATLGDRTGEIEKITIRKVQLRDLSGVVYTVPFSEISVVENLTKDFSYYMMEVGIAYREDPDEVIGLLQKISDEMEQESPHKENILGPIEIFGVDQFADSAIIIKARLKTRPMMQWSTGREFNRRMKYLFDAHNIEIPFPHQTIYFGEDKDGSSPAARVLVKHQNNGTQQQKAEETSAKLDEVEQHKKSPTADNPPKGPQQPTTEDMEDGD